MGGLDRGLGERQLRYDNPRTQPTNPYLTPEPMDTDQLNQYRALLAQQEQEREESQRLLARETVHNFVPTYQPTNGAQHGTASYQLDGLYRHRR